MTTKKRIIFNHCNRFFIQSESGDVRGDEKLSQQHRRPSDDGNDDV